MRRRLFNRRVVLALAGVAAVTGCQPTQKLSPALPAVRLDASSVAGSLLDPAPSTLPATMPVIRMGTVGVEVTWVAVTRVPADLLDPLDAHAALVSAPLAGGPVLTSGRQIAAARFGEGAAVDAFVQRLLARADGPVAQIGHQVGVIVPDATTTFRLAADGADAGQAGRSVAISLYFPADAAWVPTDAEVDVAMKSLVGKLAASKGILSLLVPATTATTTPSTNPTTRPATTITATSPATTPSTTQSDASAGPTTRPLGSMTVTLEGFRDTPVANDDAPATRPSITTTPETAYLDGLRLDAGRRYAMAFPCRLGNTPWRGIVALIDIVPPPDDTEELADVQFGRPSATQPATQASVERTLMRAVDALRTTADPRPPLLFLATATRAAIAADAILIADRPLLDRLRSELLQYTKVHDAAADAVALGWQLDRSAVLALCDAQQAGTGPPELAAVLTVHGGEVGRHADAMADAAKNVGSAADLKARLIGENTIALEDNSPAARVRAFDWLKGQGRAPQGYDPLADAHARRAAINQSISTTQGTR